MRTIYSMLLLSALLFVASIWFVIAGLRGGGPAAPEIAPVATIKQVMNGIVTPGSAAVYSAVSTVITAAGVTETAPKDDREWELVGSGATAVIEAGRMLMEPGRAMDGEQWLRMSRAMVTSGTAALKAAQSKDPEALLAAGEIVNQSCDACHREYAPGL